ncbi:Acyltransferase family [Rubrobacter radiotolerans]|uniref:Acyltransferase family n=1 Tax=Rubrobacter radiotolerans TaxID=42256 RepID=A0A023X6Y4_RUBRA|nr:acyltransferase family protein [Rubrobacter radiotolerans]AHY47834.1 Acyltransferase family [Rubrobacter radiotolerans]MDX5892473.1 acyltransferase family protein [Rubrobacter radiotolerans]SMC07764.1 peptidoglycan-N-acetylmuramate O-acetyltransferase [Rubrobacter radiotolerans DSM 5868]
MSISRSEPASGYLTGGPADRSAGGLGLPYSPGLDGLRALAVLAVLLYHAGVAWIPGGFLGVEVFFVISGFLITALLLAEYRKTGGVDLARFWVRRARRLLPAVFFMMACVTTYAVVFLPEEVAGLRSDVLAAAGYVTNWYLVFANESYFEAVGRPSLLRHLWSLAVEEQFYLLWPVVLLGGLALVRRGGVLVLTLLGVVASTALMVYLYSPEGDPSRVYYGTDTRAAGLLVGAALAFVLVPGRGFVAPNGGRSRRTGGGLRRRFGWTSPLFVDLAGLAGAAALVWFTLSVGEYDSLLYRGGFLLVAVATAGLIAAVVHPHAHLGFVGAGPLRWIGLRSYGIYLWHWPVFTVTRPDLDVSLDGPALLAARLALTFALAELSYRFVETPIRTGSLGRAVREARELRRARGRRRVRLGVQWSAAALFCTAFVGVLGANVVTARAPETPDYLKKAAIQADFAPEGAAGTTPEPRPEREKQATPDASGAEKTSGADEGADRTGPVPQPITAIGDSVMLSSEAQVRERLPEMEITDSSVGMQVADAIEILEARRDAGQLGRTVVLHVGTNGTFTEKEFEEVMAALSGVERVFFVNVAAPRTWETTNNEVIAAGVARHEKATLIDWNATSGDDPTLFYGDGIHPSPEGARIYADLIADSLGL